MNETVKSTQIMSSLTHTSQSFIQPRRLQLLLDVLQSLALQEVGQPTFSCNADFTLAALTSRLQVQQAVDVSVDLDKPAAHRFYAHLPTEEREKFDHNPWDPRDALAHQSVCLPPRPGDPFCVKLSTGILSLDLRCRMGVFFIRGMKLMISSSNCTLQQSSVTGTHTVLATSEVNVHMMHECPHPAPVCCA